MKSLKVCVELKEKVCYEESWTIRELKENINKAFSRYGIDINDNTYTYEFRIDNENRLIVGEKPFDDSLLQKYNISNVKIKKNKGTIPNTYFDKLPYKEQINKFYNLLIKMNNIIYNNKYNRAKFSPGNSIREHFRKNDSQTSESIIEGTINNNINSLNNSRNEDFCLNDSHIYSTLNTNINTLINILSPVRFPTQIKFNNAEQVDRKDLSDRKEINLFFDYKGEINENTNLQLEYYWSNNGLSFNTVNITKVQIDDHTLKVPIVINFNGNCFPLITNFFIIYARFSIRGSVFYTAPFIISIIIKNDYISAPVNSNVCHNQFCGVSPYLFNNPKYQSNYK